MKNIKQMNSVVLLIFRYLTYLMLGGVFFYVFGLNLLQLTRLSRTLAITLMTFVIVFALMIKVYGHYNVNVRKSRALVISLTISILVTDIAAFIALKVMNLTATGEEYLLSSKSSLWLLLILAIQIVIIYIMVHLGNYIYFLIVRPETTCVVIDRSSDNNKRYLNALRRYRKQYKIVSIVDYTESVYEEIDKCKRVFLMDLPIEQRNKLVNYCYDQKKKVSYTPDLIEAASMNILDATIEDVPLVNVNTNVLSIEQLFVKRMMDIVISTFAIVLTSPLWFIISIMIKREDNGPVFFLQDRYTKNNKTFKIIKFRSMIVNNNNGHFKQAVENDERITNVGKIIRKFRIDELPQFINVLVGQMSVVGPRAEAVESYQEIINEFPEFRYRLRFKAGITGLAQTMGKYNTPPLDKLKFDLLYIEQYSVMLDVKIVFQTISVLFKRESVEANRE